MRTGKVGVHTMNQEGDALIERKRSKLMIWYDSSFTGTSQHETSSWLKGGRWRSQTLVCPETCTRRTRTLRGARWGVGRQFMSGAFATNVSSDEFSQRFPGPHTCEMDGNRVPVWPHLHNTKWCVSINFILRKKKNFLRSHLYFKWDAT